VSSVLKAMGSVVAVAEAAEATEEAGQESVADLPE
jgi:hypothetical protein